MRLQVGPRLAQVAYLFELSLFNMVFKIENLKLFSGDYNVEVTSKGISKFSHTSTNLQYFIATEADSKFE